MFFLFFSIFCLTRISAQELPYEYAWSKTIGDVNEQYIYSIDTDSSGNVYYTGSFTGSVDFNPGVGTDIRVAPETEGRFFISKLTANGLYEWTYTLGSEDSWQISKGTSISISSENNIYVGGGCNGVYEETLFLNCNNSSFILNFDESGNIIWYDEFYPGEGDTYGLIFDTYVDSLTVDINNNLLVIGHTSYYDDWEHFTYLAPYRRIYDSSNTLIENYHNAGESYHYSYIDLVTNDSQKLFYIERSYTGFSYKSDNYSELTTYWSTGLLDSNIFPSSIDWHNNRLAIAGSFEFSAEFYPEITHDAGSEMSNGFITFYNTTDSPPYIEYDYTFNYGGSLTNEQFLSIDFDNNGNYVVTGIQDGNTFIMKYDSSDSLIWTKYFTGTVYPYDIKIASNSDIYIGGIFYNTVDLNPEPEIDSFTSKGLNDAFITMLDFGGDLEPPYEPPHIDPDPTSTPVIKYPLINVTSATDYGIINNNEILIRGIAIPFYSDITNVEYSINSTSGPWYSCSFQTNSSSSTESVDTDFIYNQGIGVTDYVRALSIQANSKILVGGDFYNYNGDDIDHYIRLRDDGTLDPYFQSLPGASSNVWVIVKQPDGKTLIGGEFDYYNGVQSVNLARINVDGTYDETFQVGEGFENTVYAIAVQQDGKILVGGSFLSYQNDYYARYIVRLNQDGSRDTEFELAGTGLNGSVYSIIPLENGDIMVAGNFTRYDDEGLGYIARLNEDGFIDNGFLLSIGASGASNQVRKIVQLPNGQFLVAGDFASFNGITRRRIVRIKADGSLDNTFNYNGYGANGYIWDFDIQHDGKIIIGGNFTKFNNISKNRIARLNTDGSLDEYFNTGTGFDAYVRNIKIQDNGYILAGGQFTNYNGVLGEYLTRIIPSKPSQADFECDMNFSSLPDGNYILYVKATDSIDYETEVQDYGVIKLTLDRNAQEPVIEKIGQIYPIPNQTNLYYFFIGEVAGIYGVAEYNSTVTFIRSDGQTFSTVSDSNGKFYIGLEYLFSGVNSYTYYSTDTVGNKSFSKYLTLNVGITNLPEYLEEIIYQDTPSTTTPLIDKTIVIPKDETIPTKRISIYIKNEKGDPIEDAIFTIEEIEYKSDIEGKISLPGEVKGNFTIKFNNKLYTFEDFLLKDNSTITLSNSFNSNYFILCILLIIILVIVAYYYLNRKKNSK